MKAKGILDMQGINYDIALCLGEVPAEKENTFICPLRNNCHRYLVKQYLVKAKKQNIEYETFVAIDNSSLESLRNRECKAFWNED